MLNSLEKSLDSVDTLPKTDFGNLGTWSLENARDLSIDAINALPPSVRPFDTFQEFLKRFTLNPRRPTEAERPKPDDPQFDPTRDEYENETQRFLLRCHRYEKALTQFEHEATQYATQTASTDWIRATFSHSGEGYRRFAYAEISKLAQASQNPQILASFDLWLKKKRFLPVGEKVSALGMNLVGSHGSGKSELLKRKVWNYLVKPKPRETLIIIDPHEKLAREIARMKPNLDSGRLVYIDPFMMAEHVPCFDLLTTKDKSPENLDNEAITYGSALEMVTGDMSQNMEFLAENCAQVILENDGLTMWDLLDLVETKLPKRGEEQKPFPRTYQLALKSQNFMVRRFFAGEFLTGNFGQAKSALSQRISQILKSTHMQRMLLNASRIDFQKLVNQKKVIVISLPLAKLTNNVGKMLGQMIVSQIQVAILRRDIHQIDKYPQVHLIMDEAHNFVSAETAKQINELRKFKLSLTLATQYVEQYPSHILEAVKGLGVQVAGLCAAGSKNLEQMNEVFDLKRKSTRQGEEFDDTRILADLSVGEFFFKCRGTTEKGKDGQRLPQIKARQFSTDTELLFDSPEWKAKNAERYMTDQEWERCKAEQAGLYYTRMRSHDPASVVDGEEIYSKTERETVAQFDKLEPDLGFDD